MTIFAKAFEYSIKPFALSLEISRPKGHHTKAKRGALALYKCAILTLISVILL